jgi:putative OPT family oligopeptide transporter
MSATSPVPSEIPGPDGETTAFRPYIAESSDAPELTWSSVLLGIVLGVIFGASSLYLFLKVGMTVSASIPIAVLAITIFRAVSKAFGTRRATILENNIVQTTGSAGESIAFGVGATMPALMFLGADMDPLRVMTVSVLGGLLGILMMIPLRRAFIVNQHKTLPYPEGTACAKILIAGEQGGSSAQTVFAGFGLGALFKILMDALKLWGNSPAKPISGISGYDKAVLSCDADPALLGVGYIIGARTSCIMVGGGLLASLVLIPAIAFFGSGSTTPLPPDTTGTLIRDMAPGQLSRTYVRYIGAGAVAAGGILSMIRALPLIAGSIAAGFRSMRSRNGGGETERGSRFQKDMPYAVVILGSIGLIAAVAASNLIPTNPAGRVIGAGMVLLFGFLFVTVSSRITGEIGSSSNPISGMTIATLLLTCLIFYVTGRIGPEYRITALCVAAVVCIASSNGGTTSQDLKTGYLVGATPWKQQIAILAGALTSALLIGLTLLWLNSLSEVRTRKPENLPTIQAPVAELTETEIGSDGKTYKVWRVVDVQPGADAGKYLVDPESGAPVERIDPGVGGVIETRDDGSKVVKYRPPQPELFAVIIKGIMKGELPWGLVILGATLAIVMWLCGVSPLAFAVGVYLPLSTTFPIFLGGMVRGLVDRVKKLSAEESDSSPAVLLSSGLIAGGSIAGILLATLEAPAGWAQSLKSALDLSDRLPEGWLDRLAPSLLAFGLLVAILLFTGLFTKPQVPSVAPADGDLARRGEISDGDA